MGLCILIGSGVASLEILGLIVAGLVGLLLAGLALFRFFFFVLAVLVLRPALDLVGGDEGSARLFAPSGLLALAFAGAGAAWLVGRARTGLVRSSPVRMGLIVLVVAGGLSAIGSIRPWTSLVGVAQLAFWALMFVVLDELFASRRDILQLLGAIGLSSAVPLIAGLVGAVSRAGPLVETKGMLVRVTSTFSSSNQFGRYLMLLLLMAWAVQAALPRRHRAGVLLASLPATALLVLTYTRSAWLGLAVGLVVIGVVLNRRALAGLLAVSGVLLLAVPPIRDRIFTTASPYEHAGGSISWRLSYWQEEVLPLADRNPVTGIGLGITQLQTEQGAAPHNEYLRFLVETGVVGLAAYLAFLLALGVTAVRAVRRCSDGLTRRLGVGFGACVAATLVASAVANLVLDVALMWLLMALAAATASSLRLETEAGDPTAERIPPPAGESVRGATGTGWNSPTT